ncbi:MAG TPA: CHAP domain-containing protein [Pseudonocardiaceae bacterium]
MGATRSFPALGFDPAPGDLDAVHSAVAALRSSGKQITEAHDAVSGVHTGNSWTGQAAEGFQHQVSTLGTNVSAASSTIDGASKVLGQWADDLGTMQSTADHLEQQAAQAQQQLTTAQANPDLKLAGQTFPSQEAAQAVQQQYQAAIGKVKTAQQDLDKIRQQATQLSQQHQQNAQEVAKSLTGNSAAQSNFGPRHDPPMQPNNGKNANGIGSRIASLALANQGKGAGTCSQVNSSKNSLGGSSFGTSCILKNGEDGGTGEYWCSDFAKWTWQKSGANVSGLDAGAVSFYKYGQDHNTLHTGSPQVGDAAVVQYNPAQGKAEHVGVVTAVNPDGSLQVADGDWNGQSGTQSHWAQTSTVMVHTYKNTGGKWYDSDGRDVSAFVSPATS